MPLSAPVAREKQHTRTIEIDGYRREDGMFDIEAHLTDVKTFGQTNYDRGFIPAGEPIHDMRLRLTVNETMEIVASEAVSDLTPYRMCPTAAPNFSRLVGMRIKAGFLREANQAVGGPVGCTHLRELLQQMATTAFQTINPSRVRKEMKAEGTTPPPGCSIASTFRTRPLRSLPSRSPISVNASQSSGSSRMLVRPRWATTFRLISRLAVTAAPMWLNEEYSNRKLLTKGLRELKYLHPRVCFFAS